MVNADRSRRDAKEKDGLITQLEEWLEEMHDVEGTTQDLPR